MSEEEIEGKLYHRIEKSIHEVENDYWLVVRPDIFAIPFQEWYILYSPLQGLIALITKAGLSSLLLNDSLTIQECISKCLYKNNLETIKLFDTLPKRKPENHLGKVTEFKPSSLMLSPTSVCQLACKYCYIRGGDKTRYMSWDMAEAAIEYTIGNALSKKLSAYSLNFHGEGEPTANWNLFKDAVQLTEDLCSKSSLRTLFTVASNGMLNNEKISFMTEHKFNVSLSMDGLKKTMDIQRPLRSGGSSFDKVMQTIKSFEENKIHYVLRNTVTELNLNEMSDFIGFISKETTCKQVYFEPVFNSGRAKDNKMGDSKIIKQFIKNFLKTQKIGNELGINIDSSTCKISGLRSTYCGAYGSNVTFALSSEGFVSSCYIVLNKMDPRSNIFVYGIYDSESRTFKFNEKKLERLLNLNVNNIERCKNCYLKWNCGGGCISKLAYSGFENILNGSMLDNCNADYSIIKHNLFRSVIENSKK